MVYWLQFNSQRGGRRKRQRATEIPPRVGRWAQPAAIGEHGDFGVVIATPRRSAAPRVMSREFR